MPKEEAATSGETFTGATGARPNRGCLRFRSTENVCGGGGGALQEYRLLSLTLDLMLLNGEDSTERLVERAQESPLVGTRQHEGKIWGRCQTREVHICLNLGLHPVCDQCSICQDLVDRTRSWLYAACSLSYLGAMVSSNSALQFVNYPTQVLGKSCKPIPVMLLGVTLLKKKYPVAKYLCVLLIVAGVALFMYKPKKGVGADEHLVGYGELLLLLSLTLDGLTGVSQDHMRAHYQTGSNHMMLNINLWSTLLLGAGILFTGEFWDFLSFTERFPSVLYNILLFGLTSALGQSFIFMTVVYFGPLTCSIITTTRKFFTILASVILFANPISSMQWVGTVLVFMGLGLDAKFGKGSKKTSL
ncbi:solute carrier family 35 member B1 isoform X2 [Macrotis lagotis]|uniref:solute carrier family 35 member B1 isoform X2 n=2 Tax=Macrotis lagotis TaxID=92651 RepID=UPI003D69786B